MPKTFFRFAFVSNSCTIAHAVRDYAAMQGMTIDIRLASMEKALPIARTLLEGGTDVILGGGGTGKLLRQNLERPVVTIARSHLDLLQALLAAKAQSEHIAITCYDSIPESFGILADLLHVRLRPIPFSSTRELVEGISQAVSEGVGCVVGGGFCGEIANAQGCKNVVVVPGAEVMQRALEEAYNIALSQNHDREQSAWLQGIVDVLHEGIVGIDAGGKVAASNAMAARLLGMDMAHPGTNLDNVVQELGLQRILQGGKAETDGLRQVAGQECIISTLPISVKGRVQGAVATFRPASYIRTMDGKLKEQLRTSGFVPRYSLENIVGLSPAVRALKAKALRFAHTDAAVLIQGETGTGKELLAHALHTASPRCHKPFVALNCAALPETLLESELFGYAEGAFTGARRGGKDGLFLLAHGGSIFLDEIGDIPPALQVRLLRVLEAHEIMRVGGDRPVPTNVRVISSSWKDLSQEVRQGHFRADLYYRLATLCLCVPPLRQRPEDIPALLEVLLQRHGHNRACISARGRELLAGQVWFGNIRELDALLQRYVLLLEGPEPDDGLLAQLLLELPRMQGADAPAGGAQAGGLAARSLEGPTDSGVQGGPLKNQMALCEQEIIQHVLEKNRYNRALAAKALGISQNTLWRKMKNINIPQ